MTKKNELIEKALKAKEKGDAMGLIMRLYDYPSKEVIVNPAENIVHKLNYIAKAYNDDLVMCCNPNITIEDFYFVSVDTLEVYK